MINSISLVLSVFLATASETKNPETETARSDEETPAAAGVQQTPPTQQPQGAMARLRNGDPVGALRMRPKELDPAGTHCFSAWLTSANVLVTLLGTVVLILNAVITGLAPASTAS